MSVIKSIKFLGSGIILVIVSAYILLYTNLSYSLQKKRMYETTINERYIISTFSSTRFVQRLSKGNNLTNLSQNVSNIFPANLSSATPIKSTTVSSKVTNKKKKKPRKKLNILKEIKLRSKSAVQEDLKRKYDINDLSFARNCSDWNETAMPPYARLCAQKNVDNHPLITLFTTMHYSPKDFNILNNTLRLWSQLESKVHRILFVSSPHADRHLVRIACDADWDVMTVPLCNKINLPVLKAMFMAAQQIKISDFYGYANGDILYDESLIKTLEFVKENYLQYFKKTLFVGRRTNIRLQVNQTIADLRELRVLSQNGTDGWVAAVDYFLSSRDGFDWADIPKVVVARIAYDNWMIRHATSKKFAVFDITNTTLSAHQLGIGRYYGSHYKKDSNVNNALLGPFDFTRGLITCAQLKTKFEDNVIRLKKRAKYGMCGSGHWAKRNINRYGDELETDYKPGMKL